MKTFVKYLTVSLLSFVLGISVAFGFFHFSKKDTELKNNSITSNTISGEPLTIKKIIPKAKQTVIETQYNGAGESNLTVPNTAIPSANAWDNLHWVGSVFVSTDKAIYLGGGYRYQRFTGLGGVWFRNNSGNYDGGAWIGCMYIIR